jgi:two-component system response regulator
MIDDGRLALDFLTAPVSDHLVAIFLDLKLPSISGLQLLEKIRSMDKTKKLPVIVMTSSNSPEDLAKCQELQVMSYVQKPVTFAAFSQAVASAFHRSENATT